MVNQVRKKDEERLPQNIFEQCQEEKKKVKISKFLNAESKTEMKAKRINRMEWIDREE